MISENKLREQFIWITVLVLINIFSFLPIFSADFVLWDDQSHLVENATINELQPAKFKEIFTQKVNQTYIPLTVLSFAIEHALFGYNPFVYHLDNLLLHLGVVLFVFVLAQQWGLTLFASGCAALIFSVHPMKVESVAWITERKDVLYAFFYLWALYQYGRYLKTERAIYFIRCLVLGFLSLLAKPMALSLPLILLLYDWFHRRPLSKKVILEKLPFLIYIIPIAWLTYAGFARNPVGNVGEALLIWTYTFNFYIWKFFWPFSLSPIYHLPEPISLQNGIYLCSLGFFTFIIFLIIRYWKNRWWRLAWGFYIFSIFFLLRFDTGHDIAIVADRFMYLPSLGFCMFLGWGWEQVKTCYGAHAIFKRLGLNYLIWFVIFILGYFTIHQTRIWNDTISLWSHVLKFYPEEWIAYNNRAAGFANKDLYDAAIQDYTSVLRLRPDDANIFFNRGIAYRSAGQNALSLEDFNRVIAQFPDYEKTYYHRGIVFQNLGFMDRALEDYTAAIGRNSQYIDAYFRRGNLYNELKRYPSALEDYSRVVNLNPKYALGYNNRGTVYGNLGDSKRALEDFSQAIAINLGYGEAYFNRAVIYKLNNNQALAEQDIKKAISLGIVLPSGF